MSHLKKKIIISANTSWYLYNFRKNTFKELVKRGYQVHALAPRDEYSRKLEDLGVSFIPIDIDAGGVSPIKDLKTIFDFFTVLKKLRPCVLLNFTPKNNIYATLSARLLATPVINNIAGLGTLFESKSLVSFLALFLYRVSQKHAFHVFFQNEEDRDFLISHNVVKAEKSSRLHGSGVDLNRFVPHVRQNDGVVKFLLVARLLKSKGIELYANSARDLKKKYGKRIEFYLVGFLDVDNPNAVSRKSVEKWVDEGILVYLGKSDSIELEIAKIDCIVLPSFYREGVPKTLLEAGAMGKPIITTDNVGCKETVIDGESGFICRTGSKISLLRKLEQFINLPYKQRLIMGNNSRKHIEEKFDEQQNIEQYLTLLDSLTENK